MATITTSDLPRTNLGKWTPDQESALLRAITHWKPVGMHKHFRMISIRSQLLADGLIQPGDPHTTTVGIWQKLNTLYDLPRLDEREDADINDAGDEDLQSYWRDFELPREEFEGMMWERRLAPEGTESSSPEMSRRESTVADTDEPRSSPMPSASGRGSVRGARGGARKSGRLSRLKDEVDTDSPGKAGSVAADEDHAMEDADDGGEEESGNGEEESEEEEREDDEKKGGNKRGRGGRRGRAGRRGRRRG